MNLPQMEKEKQLLRSGKCWQLQDFTGSIHNAGG
jgi:hypothetical protein